MSMIPEDQGPVAKRLLDLHKELESISLQLISRETKADWYLKDDIDIATIRVWSAYARASQQQL